MDAINEISVPAWGVQRRRGRGGLCVENPGGNSSIYCGYHFDPETQNYYVRNRYYSPVLGRWISRDPIGHSGGINLYGYVESSPAAAQAAPAEDWSSYAPSGDRNLGMPYSGGADFGDRVCKAAAARVGRLGGSYSGVGCALGGNLRDW